MNLSETDRQIYNVLRKRQQNRDVPHPAVEILFCGIPGSGKTTLAQRLARDLQAQYVQNDAARELARANGIKDFKPHAVTRALTSTIFAEDANKLVIFDASIDHTWPEAIALSRKNGAKQIIIRININPEEALARIQKRDREDGETLVELMPVRYAHFVNCKKELPADIELTVPFDYEEVLQAVCAKL